MSKPQFIYRGQDDWSRDLYESKKTGTFYANVDGKLHKLTEYGEPLHSIGSLSDVEIIMEEENGQQQAS